MHIVIQYKRQQCPVRINRQVGFTFDLNSNFKYRKLLTNCLSVFGHFVNLALKGLILPLVIIVFLVHQPYHQHLKGLYFE